MIAIECYKIKEEPGEEGVGKDIYWNLKKTRKKSKKGVDNPGGPWYYK